MGSPRTNWITSGAIAFVAGVFGFIFGVQFIPSHVNSQRAGEAYAWDVAKVINAESADQPSRTTKEILGREEQPCAPTFALGKYEIKVQNQVIASCIVTSDSDYGFLVTVRLTSGTTHTFRTVAYILHH